MKGYSNTTGLPIRLGSKFTEKQLARLSEAHMGQKAWNKGIKHPERSGRRHFAWKKQTEVSYRALHAWIARVLGKPNKCSNCKVIGSGHRMHWANLSGNYKRNPTDWVRLCAKCHKAYDYNRLALL